MKILFVCLGNICRSSSAEEVMRTFVKREGLEEMIEERTGIKTITAEEPMHVVAIGTGQYVEFMSGQKEF